MITKLRVTVDGGGDRTVVDGWTTLTPGLVVIPCASPDSCGSGDCWVVTHERSGCSVGGHAPNPEAAQAFAVDLGFADWTRSAEEVMRDPSIGEQIAAIVKRHGRRRLTTLPPSAEALAR